MEDMRQQRPVTPGSPAGVVSAVSSKGGMSKVLVSLLVVLSAMLVLGGLAHGWKTLTADSGVKGKQYQAVFLTNGQVYFGKISNVDASYVTVKDIYYLQVQQAVQPKDSKATTEQPQVSLAKLGGELHGPEDIMYISRDQVLFWENLKGENDSKVTKAINEYKASKK